MTHCIYCGKKLEGNETECPKCGKKILEYRSIGEYAYQPVSAAVAEKISGQKVGLLFKGDAKKLLEALQNGNVQTAEAVMEDYRIDKTLASDDSGTEYEYYYANLSDREGYPAPEAVLILGEIPKMGETVVLFRYLKKKTWSYSLFTQKEFEQFTKHFSDMFTVSGDGTRSRALPIMEGSVADRFSGLIGGLFSKKKK